MSVVQEREGLSRADAPRTVRAVLLGYGRVGQAVAARAERRGADLRRAGVELTIVRALVRDAVKPRQGPRLPLTAAPDDLFDDADVAIEAMGGVEPARSLVAAALDRGISVVTANKSLIAACGHELRAHARCTGAALAFEAAVVAGVPFVSALARRPLFARASALQGILNGTSHFVLSEMARGATWAHALRTAIQCGYAEPDSAADVDGRDAAEKLTILLHLCGWAGVTPGVLPRTGIDVLDAAVLAAAPRLGGVIKPAAIARLDDAATAWVGPAFVPAGHVLAQHDGIDNVLSVLGASGERVTFSGPGAGPAITAATLLDDVVEVCGGRQGDRAAAQEVCARSASPQPPDGEWMLRLAAPGSGRNVGDVLEWLAWRRLPARHVVETEAGVFARTVRAPWAVVRDAVEAARTRGWAPLALPVIE